MPLTDADVQFIEAYVARVLDAFRKEAVSAINEAITVGTAKGSGQVGLDVGYGTVTALNAGTVDVQQDVDGESIASVPLTGLGPGDRVAVLYTPTFGTLVLGKLSGQGAVPSGVTGSSVDVMEHGADPTGSADSSAAILNAAIAAGTDGTVTFNTQGVYLAGNITLPDVQHLTFRGTEGALIRKNANGPIFTTQSSGWGLNLEFHDIALDGNGATFSGPGITVGLSTVFFKFRGGRIFDTRSFCIQFTDGGVSGELGSISDCLLTIYQGQPGQTNQNVACIRLPFDTMTSGNRNIVNVRTDSNILTDDFGSENTHIHGCIARNVIMSNAPSTYPRKCIIAGTRLATIGLPVLLRGTQNAVVGNVFAGGLTLESPCANGVYVGNVLAGDVVANAGTTNNQIYGNRPSSDVVIDNGDNVYLRPIHVGAATPSGGVSADMVVGNGKLWINDGGVWKFATLT